MEFVNKNVESIIKERLNKFIITQEDINKIYEFEVDLNTSNEDESLNDLSDLLKLKNLKKLVLRNLDINKNSANAISKIKKLDKLEINSCNFLSKTVLSAEVIKLNRVLGMENVNIKTVISIEIKDTDVRYFKYTNMKKAQEIILDNLNNFNEVGVGYFVKCRVLDMKNMDYISLDRLTKLRNLRTLTLSNGTIQTRDFLTQMISMKKVIDLDCPKDNYIEEDE